MQKESLNWRSISGSSSQVPLLRDQGTPWKKKREDCRSQREWRTKENALLKQLIRAHKVWNGKARDCRGLYPVLIVYFRAINLMFCWRTLNSSIRFLSDSLAYSWDSFPPIEWCLVQHRYESVCHGLFYLDLSCLFAVSWGLHRSEEKMGGNGSGREVRWGSWRSGGRENGG